MRVNTVLGGCCTLRSSSIMIVSHVDMIVHLPCHGVGNAPGRRGGRCARVNVREPSEHRLVHTGEKARRSRSPIADSHLP